MIGCLALVLAGCEVTGGSPQAVKSDITDTDGSGTDSSSSEDSSPADSSSDDTSSPGDTDPLDTDPVHTDVVPAEPVDEALAPFVRSYTGRIHVAYREHLGPLPVGEQDCDIYPDLTVDNSGRLTFEDVTFCRGEKDNLDVSLDVVYEGNLIWKGTATVEVRGHSQVYRPSVKVAATAPSSSIRELAITFKGGASTNGKYTFEGTASYSWP